MERGGGNRSRNRIASILFGDRSLGRKTIEVDLELLDSADCGKADGFA